jgi:uncharacterized phiE125 gp8 family phage protein
MGIVQSTAPAELALTMQEVKNRIKVEMTDQDDDEFIMLLIGATQGHAEDVTRRQFVEATFTYTIDAFPSGDEIELPKPPLVSVTSVKYIDTSGVQQTFSSGNYDTITDQEPGFIRLGYNKEWPSTRDQPDAVEVIFKAGYGTQSSVPAELKCAMGMHLGHHYDHRKSVEIGQGITMVEVPQGYEDLIYPFRVPEVF